MMWSASFMLGQKITLQISVQISFPTPIVLDGNHVGTTPEWLGVYPSILPIPSQEEVTGAQYTGTLLLVLGTVLNKAVDVKQIQGLSDPQKLVKEDINQISDPQKVVKEEVKWQ